MYGAGLSVREVELEAASHKPKAEPRGPDVQACPLHVLPLVVPEQVEPRAGQQDLVFLDAVAQ